MKPGGCEEELLRALAEMPFLDRLENGGYAASVPHAPDPKVPPHRRRA